MKVTRYLLYPCLLMAASASAQNTMTSSPYSMFGLGEMASGLYGQNTSMAGVTVGMREGMLMRSGLLPAACPVFRYPLFPPQTGKCFLWCGRNCNPCLFRHGLRQYLATDYRTIPVPSHWICQYQISLISEIKRTLSGYCFGRSSFILIHF